MKQLLVTMVMLAWFTPAVASPLEEAPVFDGMWGTVGYGDGEFQQPIDLAVDAAGDVYVLDAPLPLRVPTAADYRVQRFSSSGTFLAGWGGYGYETGKFREAVAIAAGTYVYVQDAWWADVRRFEVGGTFLNKSQSLSLSNSTGVTMGSNGSLYATVFGGPVYKFGSTLTYQSKWSSVGSGVRDMDGDAFGHIYIAKTDMIEKRNLNGGLLSSWIVPGISVGLEGIATDPQGNVYATDYNNDRVLKFSPDGVLVAEWGTHGTGPGEFDGPKGIDVDSMGDIYVADSGNSRVQKFTLAVVPVERTTWGRIKQRGM